MDDIRRFDVADHEGAAAFFKDNGYVLFADYFDPQDLADFKIDVQRIISAYLIKAGLAAMAGDELLTAGILALEDVDHEFVAAIYDTIFQSPSFLRICGYRRTESMVKLLLGEADTALYGFTNRCRIDPPKDNRRTYGWHQEVFYTVPYGSFIQTWAPLIFDTTFENGTIEIAAGSHKEGVAAQSWNEAPGRATQILVDQDVVDQYPQHVVEMKVGEMLLFSGKLAHRSGDNLSDQVRYSLVGMYHDVAAEKFMTPKLGFDFRRTTPREYYDAHFR